MTSLDQFRGYTVFGMIFVNFVGGLAAIPSVLKHNNNFFSYADTIMPSFILICGFAYRMTFVKRLERDGGAATHRKFIVRSLALVLVSLALFGPDVELKSWAGEASWGKARELLALVLKAGLWEVLAIIGCAQLVIMPVIARSFAVRLGATIGAFALHLVISHLFNFAFVYGKPNAVSDVWGVASNRAWDGGFFGLLAWSGIMLAGTLAYDVVSGAGPRSAANRLIRWGLVLMAVAWGLSSISRIVYENPGGQSNQVADSPVIPRRTDSGAASASKSPNADSDSDSDANWWTRTVPMLGEPPFVKVPDSRLHNYWMMNKRVVTLPFSLVSIGFAYALFGAFLIACDLGGWSLGVFRTFGQNPLAAYAIHHSVEHALQSVVPKDSPLAWCLMGAALALFVTWLLVRGLERQKIFIRL